MKIKQWCGLSVREVYNIFDDHVEDNYSITFMKNRSYESFTFQKNLSRIRHCEHEESISLAKKMARRTYRRRVKQHVLKGDMYFTYRESTWFWV